MRDRGRDGGSDLSKLRYLQNCLVHVVLKFFSSFDPVNLPQLTGNHGRTHNS